MVLRRAVQAGRISSWMSVLYVPRGPLLDWGDMPLCASRCWTICSLAQHSGAIFLKIDPEVR